VTWYSDGSCQNAISTIDSVGCNPQVGSSYSSLRWTATPSATCSAPATTTGTAALQTPDTICCP
jgi:hypothetical protein